MSTAASDKREKAEREKAPSVAALVLNYNGKDITLQAIASLLEMTYPNFDVIHVDNGSTDGSAEAVAEAFPGVRTVRAQENRGPTSGLNLGLRAGLEAGYDYLLSLNNDIEVDSEMLSELVRSAESSPTIGCVGPKAFYYEERDRIWSAGGILQFKESATRERGMGEVDRGQYDREEEVDYINGCAILLKRSVLEEIGVWDPIYQFSSEDADLCMRLKLRGYRCFYNPRAVLWHMVSLTAGAYEPRRTFYTGRSAAIFVRRYGRLRDWLTFAAFMAGALPLAFLRELPRGNHRAVIAKLKGVVAGLKVPMTEPPAAASRADRSP